MTVFKTGDAVVLLADLPNEGLRKGQLGTVVLAFDTPTIAYETEFADALGRTVAQLPLMPHQIRRNTAGAPGSQQRTHPSRKRERNTSGA